MSQSNPDAEHSPDQGNENDEAQSSAGQEVVEKALSTSKDAVGDAWRALKIIVNRPSTGQAEAIELLGNRRCLNVGIVFGLFFVFGLWFSLSLILPYLAKGGNRSYGDSSSLTQNVGLFVFACVPLIAMTLVLIGYQKMFSGKGSWQAVVFSTGIAFLPYAVAMILSRLLGIGNIEVCAFIGLLALSTTVLMLNATLTTVLELSSRASLLLVPTTLVVVIYVSKIILASIFNATT